MTKGNKPSALFSKPNNGTLESILKSLYLILPVPTVVTSPKLLSFYAPLAVCKPSSNAGIDRNNMEFNFGFDNSCTKRKMMFLIHCGLLPQVYFPIVYRWRTLCLKHNNVGTNRAPQPNTVTLSHVFPMIFDTKTYYAHVIVINSL